MGEMTTVYIEFGLWPHKSNSLSAFGTKAESADRPDRTKGVQEASPLRLAPSTRFILKINVVGFKRRLAQNAGQCRDAARQTR